jgi:tetratricopeptide (TPR) repeat protein
MMPALSPHLEAAVARVEASAATPLACADAIVAIAFNILQKPRSVEDLHDAHALYARAESLSAADPLARARAAAGRGVVLRRLPGEGLSNLEAAREAFEQALDALRAEGDADEVAEIEMNYGLVIHTLASAGTAQMREAIAAYQRALRTFRQESHPREFAILHNNLATAYLAIKMAPDREGLREALAVQSFQEALKVVTLADDPVEYAMLQSNLGNALQAVNSSHRFENLLRAVEAYDEALKVRTPQTMPVEFANTLANKANALMNLPDDLERPEAGNPRRLAEAVSMLARAGDVFREHGLAERAAMVDDLAGDLRRDLR